MKSMKLLMSFVTEGICSHCFAQHWASWEASVDGVGVGGMGVPGEVLAAFTGCSVAMLLSAVDQPCPFPLSCLLFPSAPWWVGRASIPVLSSG